MHFLALPPTRTHSIQDVSKSAAQEFIQRYLETARSQPALHPDAQLTDQGPVPAQGGGRLGLTLHNLERIEAGLRGEQIQADITTGQTAEETQPGEAEAEWMDKDVFEREQGEDEVLVRDGPNEREDDGDDGGHEVPEGGVGETLNGVSSAAKKRKKETTEPVDKEARKKAKKERRKMEKAEKAAGKKKLAKD